MDETSPKAIEFVEGAQRSFDALAELAKSEPDLLNEVLSGLRLKPEILGQILMEHMDSDDGVQMRAYWLAVAEWMGPDWVSRLRIHAAFMAKVLEF